MTTLPTLIDRVRSLKGPDREVDYAVHEWCWGAWLAKRGYARRDDGWFTTTPTVPGCEKISAPGAYTASVDAVRDLIGEKLPGRDVELHSWSDGWCGGIGDAEWLRMGYHDAPTPALALLLAFLNALETNHD